MKQWIFIHDYIINPDYFNMFYIEHVAKDEWYILGVDNNEYHRRLAKFEDYEEAEIYLANLYTKIRD